MEIKQLLVVAGPTAVGKSVFLKRLTRQTSNDLCAQLRLSVAKWKQVNARRFDTDAPRPFTALPSEYIALHYETTRIWKRAYDHANDPGLKLLQLADKRTFVTLWAPANVLLDRLVRRDIKSWQRRLPGIFAPWSGKSRASKYARRVEFAALYRDGASELDQIYTDWFRYCSGFSSDDHWVLDTSALNNPVRPLDHALLQPHGQVADLLRSQSRAA